MPLPTGTGELTKSTPQLAQLELTFKGPLVKDSIVNTIDDLKNLNPNLNYKGKYVWVNETNSFYYLDGINDGTETDHWKKSTSRVIIPMYDPNEKWQKDDAVHLAGKIYQAKEDIDLYEDPASFPAKWLVIAGNTLTYRLLFNNTSSVIIYTDIRNPIFEIIVGEFELDDDDEYVIGSDGLISILNPEIVNAYIKQRKDLSPNNGLPYEIQFEENQVPINLSGAINIK